MKLSNKIQNWITSKDVDHDFKLDECENYSSIPEEVADSIVKAAIESMSNEELKDLNLPLILCCASGNRSGQAQHFLSQKGIDCYNGGSWLDVNYYQSK